MLSASPGESHARLNLPLEFFGEDGLKYHLLGWDNQDPSTKRIAIKQVGSSKGWFILDVEHTSRLLVKLKIEPSSLPSKKKQQKAQIVTSKVWERFLRFNETLSELEEMSNEILANWKVHLDYIRDTLHHFDDDDALEEMHDLCRRIPRMLRYITTGTFPSMEIDDDDLAYYDEGYESNSDYPAYVGRKVSHYHDTPISRPTKVKVIIEDISTGDL